MLRKIKNQARKTFQPTPEEIAAKAKFNLLKRLLLIRDDLDRNTRKSIRYANTTGQVWRLLIQSNNNTAFHDLMLNGILPTSDELAEVNKYHRNAWNYLTLEPSLNYNRTSLFLLLLELRILPRSEDLSSINGSQNPYTWFNLTCHKSQIQIFHNLLDLDIRPTQAGLDDFFKSHGVSIWWNIHCEGENGRKLLVRLLDLNLLPSNEELAKPIHNSCVWNQLFKHRLNRHIISKLFDKHIFPTSEILLRKYNHKCNIWSWILAIKDFEALANTLFSNMIYPTGEALNEIDNEDNCTPWYWMIAQRRVHNMNCLMDQNIFPDAAILSTASLKSKLTPWFLLASQQDCLQLFTRLLDNNIIPTNEDMNFTHQNSSCWHMLAATFPGKEVFNRLLDLGLLPSKGILAMVSDKEGFNLCYALAQTCKGASIIDRLVKQQMLPSARALSAVKSNGHPTNVWNNLLTGCNNHCQSVAETLIDHGVLPLTNKLLGDNDKHNEDELAKDKPAMIQFRNIAYREAMMAFLLLRYALHDEQSTLHVLNRDIIYLIIKCCFKDVLQPGYPTVRFFNLGHQLYEQHCERVLKLA